MKNSSGIFLRIIVAVHLLAAGAAQGADRAVIRFADIGGIRTWQAESAEELFVQDTNNQWYRITFAPPCQNLPFAIGISFEPDNLGNIDTDSSILVDGERCYFKSIEKTVAPVSETSTEK